jgi:hypothetical protein
MSIDTGEIPRLHEDYGNTEVQAKSATGRVATGLGKGILCTEAGLGRDDVGTSTSFVEQIRDSGEFLG